jgi:hypothetical protein
MSDQYVCLHGHFYQPTRENPWLNAIEVQDAASPYHDWNERITAECYARNAASRLLDDEQRIVQIWNNYSKINFNFGPTLLQWLSQHATDTYTKILEADRQSRTTFYGHGNAIAQIYNHVIMPLASDRDKITQVIWAIRDFERRFRRRPEGMWLSETAVDRATLEVLAAQGMAFTILAPHQAKRILRPREGQWVDVSPENLDVTIPYRCPLPQGKSITIFFYDGPLARAIAFEGLLRDGRDVARRLSDRLAGETSYARLLTVATDGETFGHHHRFGEMALASALHQLEEEEKIRVTNLGAYVAAHPPTVQVEIQENTSWSCPHGLERWRSNCGCTTGKGHQRWRGPLREAISWLTNELDTLYETEGGNLFRDPWKARNDAVDLIDPAPGATDAFFARHATGPVAAPQRIARLRLLEMARQGLLMQSSDGWFFDDIAGEETVQILSHAARAIELASTFGKTLEEEFIRQLQAAPGNTATYPDGAVVFAQLVRPRVTSPERITAVHAITALVEPAVEKQTLYAWSLKHSEAERATSGDHTLVVGRLQIRSTILEEETASTYALLHFGGHEVHCAVRLGWTDEEYAQFREAVVDQFGREILSEVIRSIDLAFGPAYYTLKDLPLDDRRRVLASLLEQTLANLERGYRQHYQDNRALMVYLREAQVVVPPALVMAATFVLARDLEQAIGGTPNGPLSPRAFEILEELRSWGREAYPHRFEPLLRRRLETALVASAPLTDGLLWATQVLDLAEAAGITLNLWEAQNRFYRLLQRKTPAAAAKLLDALGQRLTFNMESLQRQPTALEES